MVMEAGVDTSELYFSLQFMDAVKRVSCVRHGTADDERNVRRIKETLQRGREGASDTAVCGSVR
jgi:hypothetical protein